jgi:hypothetical protein
MQMKEKEKTYTQMFLGAIIVVDGVNSYKRR